METGRGTTVLVLGLVFAAMSVHLLLQKNTLYSSQVERLNTRSLFVGPDVKADSKRTEVSVEVEKEVENLVTHYPVPAVRQKINPTAKNSQATLTAFNFSTSTVPADTSPALRPSDILILIISDAGHLKKYRGQVGNFECYAKLQGYQMLSTDVHKDCLPIKDFFFRKHCTTYHTLLSPPDPSRPPKWIAVFDGDNLVINMNRTLEPFIDPTKDVIHYMRFHNNEIMAGNYMVKNSEYGRGYVKEWSEMVKFGYINADNGALHGLLLKRLTSADCGPVPHWGSWPKAWHNYGRFVTCVNKELAKTGCEGGEWNNIKIYPRGHGWSYDTWVVQSRWNENSFVHHAQKNPQKEFQDIAPPTKCDTSLFSYSNSLKASESVIQELLQAMTVKKIAEAKSSSSPWGLWGYDPTSCVQRV